MRVFPFTLGFRLVLGLPPYLAVEAIMRGCAGRCGCCRRSHGGGGRNHRDGGGGHWVGRGTLQGPRHGKALDPAHAADRGGGGHAVRQGRRGACGQAGEAGGHASGRGGGGACGEVGEAGGHAVRQGRWGGMR